MFNSGGLIPGVGRSVLSPLVGGWPTYLPLEAIDPMKETQVIQRWDLAVSGITAVKGTVPPYALPYLLTLFSIQLRLDACHLPKSVIGVEDNSDPCLFLHEATLGRENKDVSTATRSCRVGALSAQLHVDMSSAT